MKHLFKVLTCLLGSGMFCTMLIAQPTNDDLCNATELIIGQSCNGAPNADNTGATVQPNEPVPQEGECNTGGAGFSGRTTSVWFKVTAPASGFIDIRTDEFVEGTLEDTEMALYTLSGGDCSDLSQLVLVDCNQDREVGDSDLFFNAVLTQVEVIPGETYYIQVSGWGFDGTDESLEGSFCITVSESEAPMPAAPNDSICNATPLIVGASCNGIPNGDNTNAGAEDGEFDAPDCFLGAPNSVWYSFTAPASGFVSVSSDFDLDVSNPNEDTEMALYRLGNGSCDDPASLEYITCNQDGGKIKEFNAVLNSVKVTPGETIFIQVSGFLGSEGAFCIEVDEVTPPANDNVCSATALVMDATCDGVPNADNTFATQQDGEAIPACFSENTATLWYSFVAPSSGFVAVKSDLALSGENEPLRNTNTTLAVYDLPGEDCNVLSDLRLLTCSENGGRPGFENNAVIDTLALTPGNTYYIQASSPDLTRGPFCVEVSEVEAPFVPEGDDVCDAVSLAVDGMQRIFTHKNATIQNGETALERPTSGCEINQGWCGDSTVNNTIWYSFTAPSSGAVRIDLCNDGEVTTFDTQIALFQVGDCEDFNSFTFIAANDDLEGCSFASQLEAFCLTPGETYHFMVDGFNGEEGVTGITLSELNTEALVVSGVETLPSCETSNNGQIQLSVSNGAPPYSYAWNTGETTETLSSVGAGEYMVTVSDACDSTSVRTFTLIQQSPLTVDVGADTTLCAGEQIMLGGSPTAVGGVPFSRENVMVIDLESNSLSRVELQTPANLSEISAGLEGDYVGGDLGPGGLYVLDSRANQLILLDSLTGSRKIIGNSQPITNHRWRGIAWDIISQKMFGLSIGNAGGGQLYQFNLESGTAIPTVAIVGLQAPEWIAISNDGEMYALDLATDDIFLVDINSGVSSRIGNIGFDANFTQDADFDPFSNNLYMAAFRNGSFQSELRQINLATGRSTSVGIIAGTGQVGAFAISGKDFTSEYEYDWSPVSDLNDASIANPVASPQVSTAYSLRVTDACGTTDRIFTTVIVSDPDLSVSSTDDNGTGNGSATATVSGGVPPYTYLWSDGQTTRVADSLSEGIISVTITDDAGCMLTESTTVGLTTSIEDQLSAGINSLAIFPNPANDILEVSLVQERAESLRLEVISLNGQIISNSDHQATREFTSQIDISRLSPGYYILKVENETGATYERFAVMR